MGRHKIEDQFKEKLSAREINPSAGSWEKLSGQLDSEGKNPRPVFWWIGIAATLLGAILIAGIVYYNETATEGPAMVDAPVEVRKEESTNGLHMEEAIVAEENMVHDSVMKDELPSVKKEKILVQEKNLHGETIIAEVKEENIHPGTEEIITHNDAQISKKLEEIIAEVSMQDELGVDPTYDEIEALLYKAASEISMERNMLSPTGTVDAGDLLFAVEMELEESFREKVFDILKENYLKARTAVANRNF
jgi:hypothetical protein